MLDCEGEEYSRFKQSTINGKWTSENPRGRLIRSRNYVKGSRLKTGHLRRPPRPVQKTASASKAELQVTPHAVQLCTWALRMLGFILAVGRWFVRVLRGSLGQYWTAEFLGSTVRDSYRTLYSFGSVQWITAPWKRATSPLLPLLVKDRMTKICPENFENASDRDRLLFEFNKIVAPQVSTFRLGEIVVPASQKFQLATYVKAKLEDRCRSQLSSLEQISAAVCGSILNLGPDGSTSEFMEAWGKGGTMQQAIIYMAAVANREKIHLVLVGKTVENFLGSNEFRTRFNPPLTDKDRKEWQTWNVAHLQALKESLMDTAEELLSLGQVTAEVL